MIDPQLEQAGWYLRDHSKVKIEISMIVPPLSLQEEFAGVVARGVSSLVETSSRCVGGWVLVKKPDRFLRKSCVRSLMSARGLRLTQVTVKPVRSGLVESLRGRMGESTRQACTERSRSVEGLFESLLAQSFDDER